MPKEVFGLFFVVFFTLKLLLCREKSIYCNVTFQNYFFPQH